MLTKSDLQAIQKIVKSGGDSVKSELRSEFRQTLIKELKPIKSSIKKIEKNTDVMVSSFNRDDMRLVKRVKRIEGYLHLEPLEN